MIQRYTVGNKPFSIDEDPEGDFVFYSDHEAIVKELVEALEYIRRSLGELILIERLEKENADLRKCNVTLRQ